MTTDHEDNSVLMLVLKIEHYISPKAYSSAWHIINHTIFLKLCVVVFCDIISYCHLDLILNTQWGKKRSLVSH